MLIYFIMGIGICTCFSNGRDQTVCHLEPSCRLGPFWLLQVNWCLSVFMGRKIMHCSSDIPSARTLRVASFTNVNNMTIESCLAFCTPAGYNFAGLEFSRVRIYPLFKPFNKRSKTRSRIVGVLWGLLDWLLSNLTNTFKRYRLRQCYRVSCCCDRCG